MDWQLILAVVMVPLWLYIAVESGGRLIGLW
jgi:hypothetical protein